MENPFDDDFLNNAMNDALSARGLDNQQIVDRVQQILAHALSNRDIDQALSNIDNRIATMIAYLYLNDVEAQVAEGGDDVFAMETAKDAFNGRVYAFKKNMLLDAFFHVAAIMAIVLENRDDYF